MRQKKFQSFPPPQGKFFWVQKFLGPKIFFDSNNFWPKVFDQHFFGIIIFFGDKILRAKKFFEPKFILASKFFCTQIFSGPNIFLTLTFFNPKFSDKILFVTNKFLFYPIFLFLVIFWTKSSFGSNFFSIMGPLVRPQVFPSWTL